MTLSEAFRRLDLILLRPGETPAERAAAELVVPACSPGARIEQSAPPGKPALAIRLVQDASPWYSLAIHDDGNVLLTASAGSLLIALATLATESWGKRPASDFAGGEHVVPAFRWLRNLSDFLVGSLRFAEGFNRGDYCRQLARQGFTHVTINGLGAARPFESGPPGDVYHWFYDYSPDLDQFVESALLKGYYPPDYLSSNLAFLKETAGLARRYGLTPGLHINSPRSMPEEFWHRYGFLRGARVDHPRETLRPRYTLAMAHPVVQEHYRELLRKILKEVPDIGFIHLWTNDSGSGFEFVSSLYAGRNGGPYLLREWKSHEEIARKAGENVLTYLRLLRDEGRRVNPGFRLVCDLGPFSDERPTIISGMGSGIDAGDFAYFEVRATTPTQSLLQNSGAEIHGKLDVGDNNVLGVPFPRLVHERLSDLRARGTGFVLTGGTPESLAPFDINREIVRAFQLTPDRPPQEVMREWARTWGGELEEELLGIWELSDRAVRAFPAPVPMSTFGFPWFRLWVRPFVPDIDAIPEERRSYYERFLLATFNNPARIDLNNDMMWNFLTPAEAGGKKRAIDDGVLPPLTAAIDRALAAAEREKTKPAVFADLLDRLRAARCFCRTMRNTMAWTESVHGFLRAGTAGEKELYRNLAGEMVENELDNARDLLALVQTRRVAFMPILSRGETLHGYGKNIADLLQRKIALMEQYGDREPRVDPGYMWRMPADNSRADSERRGG